MPNVYMCHHIAHAQHHAICVGFEKQQEEQEQCMPFARDKGGLVRQQPAAWACRVLLQHTIQTN